MNLTLVPNTEQRIPERTKGATANLFGMSMLLTALWLLLHPYAGIRHDARLYTLQALAHLNPELYSQDIFLRFGSQEKYTFFTPIYAHLSTWLGIEHAAALLTALGQVGFLATCWFLTKAISNTRMATLTLGLVLIFPGNYGADYVFTYLETFLTPRLFSEAFTLAAIGCFLRRYWLSSATLLLAALLLHPIMAVAGLAFIAASLALQFPTQSLRIGGAGVVVAMLFILSPISNNLHFDVEWLAPVNQRSPYLFIRNWEYADWARLSVPMASLLLSSLLSPTAQQQSIAKAAMFVALAGLILAVSGSDIGHLILVTQGQAWRWLWLSTLLALLLCPTLLRKLWATGKAGQSTCLLLVSAWLVRNEASSLGLAIFAGASGLACYKGNGSEKSWQNIWLGAWLMFGATVAWMLAINLLSAGLLLSTSYVPNWLDELRGLCTDGLVPLSLLSLSYIAINSRRPWIWHLHVLCSSAACITMAWYYWPNWRREEYPASLIMAMDAWRQHIPAGEEVLWLNGPTPSWLLLQRPNYISGIQTTVTLFSRPATMVLRQRAKEIEAVFPNSKPLTWTGQEQANTPTTGSLSDICSHIKVNFLVVDKVLDSPALAIAPSSMPSAYSKARLYQCKN